MGRSPNDPYHFFELLRPPLVPYIIALVWTVIGVSYNAAALIQPIFTVASAFVFFLLLKEMFGLKPAFIGSLLLLVAPEIFFWTNQILVHGEVLFFMITAYYFLWRGVHGRGRYSLPIGWRCSGACDTDTLYGCPACSSFPSNITPGLGRIVQKTKGSILGLMLASWS